MAVQTETLPVIEIESDEDQRLLSQDTGVANEGFIDNVGFVSGLPRFEDQLGPGESNLDDNDPDPQDPGPSGPALSLGINITSPVSNQVFYFPVSQQGGKITAKGQVMTEAYIIQSVDVKFGDSGFLPATFTYDPSTDSYDWKCTSSKITTSADMDLAIVARVTGRKPSGSVNTKTASKTVKIKITDDVRPTVKITKPLPASPLTPIEIKDSDGDGVFTVTLEGTAADNTNELDRVEISLNGAKPINFSQHPSNWTATFTLPFKTTTQTISVCAFDKKQNSSETQQLLLKTIDDKLATLQITAPEGSVVELPLVDGAAGVVLPRLEGTSKDLQSGVKKVEWGVGENPQFLPANQDSSNWSKWSVKNIFIPGPVGPKNIRVRCVNGAGLFTVKDLNVAVTELYPPRNPTIQEYFSNLLDFIVRRVIKSTGANTTAPLKVEDLTAALYQPFQSLLGEDKALQTQQVHQLRICIEILRKHFAKIASATPGSVVVQATAVLQSAESKYRQRVYESMLNRLGVSFEELRLIRLLDPQACRALAQRLGFDFSLRTVDGTAPDNPLAQFLLQPGQFTEAGMETLFGLVDTTRDPLQKRDFNPKLLELQLQHLEEVWAEQDVEADRPVIDPDVIGEAHLYPGANQAYGLWQDRQTWVKNQLKVFRDQLKQFPPTKGASVFDQVVSGVLGSVRDLETLEGQLEAGADVEDRLSEMQLTLPAFVRLMKLRKLSAAGALLDLEVDDVASILTQVKKVRSFADWRKEEQEAELVLGPDFFRLPIDQETVVPPEVSPEWRVGADSRRLWQDTLQARIDQQKSLRQALLSVIDAAEEESLPLLRDGLAQAMAELSPLFDADALSRQLLVDIKTSGFQKITRVEQAIQTLQNLLIDLRTSKLSLPWSLNTTNESQEELDEELRWMGAYANWYSAMQVFLFPENLLLPTLRPMPELPPNEHTPSVMEKETQTHAFRELIEDLRRDSQLTPERARSYARQYFDRLKSDYQAKGFFLPASLTAPLPPNKPFQITEQYTQGDLSLLANRTHALINLTTGGANPPAVRLQIMPAYLREIFYFVPIALALQLQKSGQYLSALDWFRVVYAYDLPADKRKIYFGLKLEQDLTPDPALLYRRNIFWLKDSLNPHEIVNNSYNDPGSPANPRGARHGAYTRFVVISLARCLLDFADAEFACDTNESLPRARSLYMRALDLLNTSELKPPNISGLPANPVVSSLKFRAEVNLAKLRSGRNIAGFKRQLEQMPSAGQSTGILPLIVGAGPFGASSARTLQPTPYRYSALIDRAKQLVTVAQQVEATYLATLEKQDIEAYNLFKATQDLGLAQANVQLQNLRVTEAADGVTLAQKQQDRATFQVQSFQKLLDTGMNVWERQLLGDYRDAREARNWKLKLDAAVNIAEVINEAASGGFLGTGIGPGLASTAGAAAQILSQTAQAIEMSKLEARTQEHSLLAGVENRKQEWALQKGLAQKDVAISLQQWQLARDHQNIVEYELFIARIQTANAQATVEFLSRKFTNVELYEWMGGILQEVYSYFLQQAAAMARLAQNQLAFERQESTPLFIKNDYWQPPSDGSVLGGSSDPDRRGLTGSARLLQDISQLEQFAFETNRRKLQLSKTFSLARLAPLEFQRFRETGALSFATPMQLFDQDFPGHYLRLVKRVRSSVVALIPPNQGIRATLSTPGVSRVVIGGDVFQTVTVRRDPESVALTSPSNATGLFELEAQSDLLLPFEFMGVDTFWSLEMPKAANPFDYRTIADVLFTIEYTALGSLDYRWQVIQRLDRKISADRAFSFRQQFADQWYDLHNPDQTARPMTVSFSTARQDFPPNIEQLATAQVALYFVLDDGKTLKDLRARLRFTEQGTQTAIGGEGTATPDGIISTRLGNAPSWTPMINRSPFGMWELALPDTAEVRNLFANEAISDIVFVLTTSGRTPAWPL